MSEPSITINGRICSEGQAMTIRVAVCAFAISLQDGLGDDEHGRFMTKAYRERCDEVIRLMLVEPKP